MQRINKDLQYYKFCLYGFLKNLQFMDPFILLFLIEAGLSYTSIGFLFSIRAVSTNIMEVPSGIFADGFGRRKAMILCFTAYILSFTLFFLSDVFAGFAAAMVLFATGEAFRTGTHKSMIITYLELTGQLDRKIIYYGHTRSWSQGGSALSAAIAALLVFISGSYRILFLFSIIPYIGGLFLMASYPSVLEYPLEKDSKGRGEAVASRWYRYRQSFSGLARLVRERNPRNAVLNTGIFGGVFKAVKDYVQPLLAAAVFSGIALQSLTREEGTAVLVGCMYVVIYILNSLSARASHKVAARIGGSAKGVNRMFLAGSIIIILTGGFLFLDLNLAAAGSLVILYIIRNLRRPMEVDVLSSLISRKSMAAGLSGESQVQTLMTAVISPALGNLIDHTGMDSAFLLIGLLSLGLAFLFRVGNIREYQSET